MRGRPLAALFLATRVAFAGLSAAAPPGPAGAPPAGVILVRHAEKAGEPAADPPLSALGQARAAALAAALKEAGVTAIVTSQLSRTRETARPLAALLGLTPEIVPVVSGAVPAHVDAVAAAVRRHGGGVVLVVGHSNTLPAIAAALTGALQPEICDSEYGSLVVLVPQGGTMRVVRGRYGAADATPPGPECR